MRITVLKQKDLRPFQAADPLPPACEEGRQLVTFRLVKFDSIAYVHQCLV